MKTFLFALALVGATLTSGWLIGGALAGQMQTISIVALQ